MLLLTVVFSIFFALFFYCHALQSGLPPKRWTLAGLIFGPIVWPFFCMKRRMVIYRKFGFEALFLKA